MYRPVKRVLFASVVLVATTSVVAPAATLSAISQWLANKLAPDPLAVSFQTEALTDLPLPQHFTRGDAEPDPATHAVATSAVIERDSWAEVANATNQWLMDVLAPTAEIASLQNERLADAPLPPQPEAGSSDLQPIPAGVDWAAVAHAAGEWLADIVPRAEIASLQSERLADAPLPPAPDKNARADQQDPADNRATQTWIAVAAAIDAWLGDVLGSRSTLASLRDERLTDGPVTELTAGDSGEVSASQPVHADIITPRPASDDAKPAVQSQAAEANEIAISQKPAAMVPPAEPVVVAKLSEPASLPEVQPMKAAPVASVKAKINVQQIPASSTDAEAAAIPLAAASEATTHVLTPVISVPEAKAVEMSTGSVTSITAAAPMRSEPPPASDSKIASEEQPAKKPEEKQVYAGRRTPPSDASANVAPSAASVAGLGSDTAPDEKLATAGTAPATIDASTPSIHPPLAQRHGVRGPNTAEKYASLDLPSTTTTPVRSPAMDPLPPLPPGSASDTPIAEKYASLGPATSREDAATADLTRRGIIPPEKQRIAYDAPPVSERPKSIGKRRYVEDINYAGLGSPEALLEALRHMGANAKALGLPASLWCADFMNMVLRRTGLKATGSRAARSYLKYGQKIDEPRVGAIAIFTRGKSGGHIGIVRGTDGAGNPIIVSGNHNNKVAEAVYPKHRVIAYVVPPPDGSEVSH